MRRIATRPEQKNNADKTDNGHNLLHIDEPSPGTNLLKMTNNFCCMLTKDHAVLLLIANAGKQQQLYIRYTGDAYLLFLYISHSSSS